MSSRIKHIKPPCDYCVDGIMSIKALDFDDFRGFRFHDDNIYDNCLVTDIFRSGEFIEIAVSDVSKYNSELQNGIYTHKLETFVEGLSADLSAMLHLATKRKYLFLYQTRGGRYFCFGYESGATLSYTNQTSDGTGALVTVMATSIYPLFEVDKNALTTQIYNSEFVPDFKSGAYCETN